ncbi:MAG: cytochrome c [Candidatus Accumulibacter sp.]|jgi:cytochrome c55X|uniref:c-type cytochrome n=2 Tax=Candidatus Accumulibacter TaxID=327159 RepID=UPI001AD59337|nr:cytochrome c [Accumulibacter sp.]MBK8384584.1 cytochrome c [Accumulibacter sp.]MBK8578550.1 cytochrome c [Candidatus Accumulibacter propinquus]MBN8436706.1 cytochrome c [Accumulibacter sp.]
MPFRLALALALLLSAPVVMAESTVPAPSAERRQQLVHLVRQDCGSCHGMTLQGGLGPSLRPEALRDKPVDSLVATIYSGRPGTPMPPWHRFLSEAEVRWIVEQLLLGFPE